MRRFLEFKGQSFRLDYDRDRADFVIKTEPHPFLLNLQPPSTLKFWTAPGLTFANFLKYRGMQEHLIQLRVGLMGQPRQRQACRL